jgi:hypothetical protein
MNIHKFRRLNEMQQLSLTEQKGVAIAERKTAYCSVHLFQLHSFYVELYQHSHFNVVTRVHSFTGTALLEPYLESISIDDLFATQ